MQVIECEHVSKLFHPQGHRTIQEFVLRSSASTHHHKTIAALSDISFSIAQGESVAIRGGNGSGKSTLLKLLAGILEPTDGTIRARGRVAPLLELGAGFAPDLTGFENVFLNAGLLGIPRKETKASLLEIVEFAELDKFIDLPLKQYSSGMTMRLAFSIAVHLNCDILLLDEILSVGDSRFREKSLQKMIEVRDNGVTCLLVTHSEAQARQFCQRQLTLSEGRLIEDRHLAH